MAVEVRLRRNIIRLHPALDGWVGDVPQQDPLQICSPVEPSSGFPSQRSSCDVLMIVVVKAASEHDDLIAFADLIHQPIALVNTA
jgi:hypothetical protein